MKRAYLLALAVVAAAASTSFSNTELEVDNYGFEAPDASTVTYIGAPLGVTPNPNYVTGWTTTDPADGDIYTLVHISDEIGQHIEDVADPGDGAGGGGSVYQVMTGLNGTFPYSYDAGTYTLTAFAGPAGPASYLFRNATYETGDIFYFALASAPTTPIASTVITATADGMAPFTVTLDNTLSTYSGPIVIGFQSPAQSVLSYMDIDNFYLTFTSNQVAPEPSSIAIATLGGVALLGLLWRRRLNRS